MVLFLYFFLLWGHPVTAFCSDIPDAAAENLLLDENFASVANGSLPEGWEQVTGQQGAAYVENGSLIIDGTADNYTATAVNLPENLAQYGNYRIDAQFTIQNCNSDSRWIAVKYRIDSSGEPYYQMAIRQNATAANGTELAYRENGWTILNKTAFVESISAAKTYTLTIIVYDNLVHQYLNGILLHDSELTSGFLAGGIGLQAAGAVLKMDSIKVFEQTEPPLLAGVLLNETFNGTENGSLPEGWEQVTGQQGAAYVEDGSLIIDGTANNYTATAVDLPDDLNQYGNYRIDAQFTIASSNSSSRWAGFKYRIQNDGEPYHQMAIRQNATAANGTEVAYRQGGWTILDTASFKESISAGKTYTLTIIVHDDRVQQYLEGILLHDSELLGDSVIGGIGLQAAGAVLKVSSIKISEQTESLPRVAKIYTVKEPETGINMAPTFICPLESLEGIESMTASSALFYLDSRLELATAAGEPLGSVNDILDKEDLNILPIFYVKDLETVEALSEVVNEKNIMDITLISSDSSLIRQARTRMPMIRGAVDFTQSAFPGTPDTLLAIKEQTNQALSKIAVLPSGRITRENVNYLQRMMITVWTSVSPLTGKLPASISMTKAAQIIASGVNGIVTPIVDPFTGVLTKFKPNTLLRRPIVVGHRGVPSIYPENTLEGAIHAYELGAQAIENDIYLTRDNHIVIMHDSTVDRTTDGTGDIESMSLEEIKALTIQHNTFMGLKVPTIDEFFVEFKGKPVTHFVEIKSGNLSIVQKLKELIDVYDVADQVIVISFSDSQLKEMARVLPGISVGKLTGFSASSRLDKSLRSILTITQPLSSVFSATYSDLTPQILGAAKHRGMSFWLWTYASSQFDFENDFVAGTHGLTTNYSQWAGNYPVQIEKPEKPIVAIAGQPVEAVTNILLQNRTRVSRDQFEMVVLTSTAPYRYIDEKLVFDGPGVADVILDHDHELDFDMDYHIYSEPVKVIVKKQSRKKKRR